MNSSDHTLYPDEDQVVIDDGLPFNVVEITKNYGDECCHLSIVKLRMAPFESQFVEKEYLNKYGKTKIKKQIVTSLNKCRKEQAISMSFDFKTHESFKLF